MYCNVCVYVYIANSLYLYVYMYLCVGDHLVQASSLLCHPSLEKLIIINLIN